jgi:hypothetical protein
MITSKVTKQVSIPHEEGEWFRFRMLSGKQLEEAADRIQAKYLSTVKTIGMENIRAFQDEATDEAEPKAKSDPSNAYEVDTILRYGVIAWSYQEKLSPQTLGDLDDVTRVWAMREILDLTLPKPEDSGNG